VGVLLVLVLVELLGVAAIQIALLGERSARSHRDAELALQAAQAALVDAELDMTRFAPICSMVFIPMALRRVVPARAGSGACAHLQTAPSRSGSMWTWRMPMAHRSHTVSTQVAASRKEPLVCSRCAHPGTSSNGCRTPAARRVQPWCTASRQSALDPAPRCRWCCKCCTAYRRCSHPPVRSPHRTGFTLLELLFAVAVLGILLGIALPSYHEFVLRGRRAEGRAALLELLQAQEHYAYQTQCYLGFSNTPSGQATLGAHCTGAATAVPFRNSRAAAQRSPTTGSQPSRARACRFGIVWWAWPPRYSPIPRLARYC